MRVFALALLLASGATSAAAENAALIFGNEGYDTLGRLSRGTEPVAAGEALRAMGYEVIAVPNVRSGEMGRSAGAFLDLVEDAERLVVVLSGRFVTDGDRTWFAAANARAPAYLDMGAAYLPLETVLNVLAGVPGGAILMLGSDPSEDAVFGDWLREGIGALDVPQGVTVLRGLPRDVANFIEDDLVRPEANLAGLIAADRSITGQGFLPQVHLFMGPRPDPDAAPETDPAAEAALWEGAVALNSVEGYQNYLARYPEGLYAAEARERIGTILAEPNRNARLEEEALNLSRDARREIQRDLTILDYNTRGIDGIFGSGTRGAILNWQQENGFAQTSYLNAEQIARLDAQAARRAAEIEAEAERLRQEDLRRDRAFWEETGARGDEPGLRAYLERYPDGAFAAEAETALAIIEEEKRVAAEAEDRAAWDAAREVNSVEAYNRYLSLFPDGSFGTEAEAQISALTEASQNSEVIAAAEAREAALNLNPITRTLVEAKLDQLGLNPGPVDGRFGPPTRRAIRTYQRDRDLPVTGYLDEQTIVRLLADTINSRN